MIDLNSLPKEIRDIIELKEQTDMTFNRFVDENYSDIWWNLLAERSDPNTEHSMIASITGLQGCHLRGTLVQTKRGLIPIEEVVAGDTVWSGSAWRVCVPIIKGRQQTLRVTLRSGVVLNMTPDHVMRTSRGWVSAEDLCPGDSLVSGNAPWSTEWNANSERAMVIGMLQADGHLDVLKTCQKYDYVRVSNRKQKKVPKTHHEWMKYRVRLYNKDEEVHSRFKKALVEQYGATATGEYNDVFNGVCRSSVTCIQNEVVFKKLVADGAQIGKKSTIVEIPSWILADDAAMNGFLVGYFVCDGSFYLASKRKNGVIEITSCSEKVLRQMQCWLLARGVVSSLISRSGAKAHHSVQWRLIISQWDSVKEWAAHVPTILQRKAVIVGLKYEKQWVKYDETVLTGWREARASGKSYRSIADAAGVDYTILWKALNKSNRGKRAIRKSETKEYLLQVSNIELGEVGDVFDLHVKDVHEYIANGLVSHNSGKSLSAIAMCSFMDPNFSVDNIYFNYNDLVHNRSKLKPNTAVLVDEQSQSYGLDSHRVMIILANLKEQLRKKSIHFFFCAPVLYDESKSSMYIIETIFIDYEAKEVYAALKTREGLTLGHITIPHPLKSLEDGSSLVSKEFMDAYQKKKDEHLERVLGNRDVDVFEERARFVMKSELFLRAEKIYLKKMGYIPQSTLIQIINKLLPEYNAGVVPLEIAGRIKLDKELSGKWEVSGQRTKKDLKTPKPQKGRLK